MSRRESFFLILTVIGFIVPNTMLIVYLTRDGGDFGSFVSAATGTLPAAQIAADISIAFVAFVVWAAWEGRRLGMRSWWVPVPASLLVGLCFGLPLFLFLRERKLSEPAVPA